MADKEKTLAKIRAALGRQGQAAPPDPLPPFTSSASMSENIVDRFCAELEKVSGRLARARSSDDVKNYIDKMLPRNALVKAAVSDGVMLSRAGIREWLAGRGARVLPTLAEFASADSTCEGEEASLMERYKRELIDADLGVTSADYAIADTGTLVLVSGGEQHRMISLVPPAHVCLLDEERIVANLTDLMKRVREESYSKASPPQAMTFITGPSRTADIELSLTLGVHGPRELHVLLCAPRALP